MAGLMAIEVVVVIAHGQTPCNSEIARQETRIGGEWQVEPIVWAYRRIRAPARRRDGAVNIHGTQK